MLLQYVEFSQISAVEKLKLMRAGSFTTAMAILGADGENASNRLNFTKLLLFFV